MPTHLAPGYVTRRPTFDDIPAVHALTAACDLDDFGEAEGYSEAEIRDEWSSINLERDAWLVISPSGAVVGYASIRDREHVRMDTEIYVHPDHQGHGIGSTLVAATEERAREHVLLAPPHAEVVLHNWINGKNTRACHLLEQAGYHPVRYFLRMETFITAPPKVTWPDSIRPRTFEDGDAVVFYRIAEDAMADHWGHVPQSLEAWTSRFITSKFDPGLWTLAMAGDEPAGFLIASISNDVGWIDLLGVGKQWRHIGLGTALLNHAFGEFYRRKVQRVALGVDAASLTGATRIYERAGMHVAQQHTTYGKVLRPASAGDSSEHY